MNIKYLVITRVTESDAEDHFANSARTFQVGELLVVDADGREVGPRNRRPAEWNVDYEVFDYPELAVARIRSLTRVSESHAGQLPPPLAAHLHSARHAVVYGVCGDTNCSDQVSKDDALRVASEFLIALSQWHRTGHVADQSGQEQS